MAYLSTAAAERARSDVQRQRALPPPPVGLPLPDAIDDAPNVRPWTPPPFDPYSREALSQPYMPPPQSYYGASSSPGETLRNLGGVINATAFPDGNPVMQELGRPLNYLPFGEGAIPLRIARGVVGNIAGRFAGEQADKHLEGLPLPLRIAGDVAAGVLGGGVGIGTFDNAPRALRAADSALADTQGTLRTAAPEAFQRGRGNVDTAGNLRRAAIRPEDITPRQTYLSPTRESAGLSGGADLPPITEAEVDALHAKIRREGLTPENKTALDDAMGRLFRPDYNATPEGPATAADIGKNLQRARAIDARTPEVAPPAPTNAPTTAEDIRQLLVERNNLASDFEHARHRRQDTAPIMAKIQAIDEAVAAARQAETAAPDPFARFDTPGRAAHEVAPITPEQQARIDAKVQERINRPPRFPLSGTQGGAPLPGEGQRYGRGGRLIEPGAPTEEAQFAEIMRRIQQQVPRPVEPPPVAPREPFQPTGIGALPDGPTNREIVQQPRLIPSLGNTDEIVRRWQDGNRVILDRIGNDRPLFRGVEAAITGDLPDSFVSAALHRKAILRSALEADGVPEATAKEATDNAFARELVTHYGGKVPDDVKAMLNKTFAGSGGPEDMSALDTFVQRWKNTAFGLGDLGVFGVQGLNAIRRGNIPMMAGMINRTLAAVNLPHIATEIANTNLAKSTQYALDGLHMGIGSSGAAPEAGTMFSYLGKYGKALDTKFVTRASDALTKVQFQNVLGSLRNLTYEGDLVMLRALGRDIQNPRVRAQAAANANVLSSFAETALNAGRRSFENKAFTSASMTRARARSITQMARLIDPRWKGGSTIEQRLMAATMIASTYGTYTMFGKWLNDQIGIGDFQFDPSKAGYGLITSKFTNKDGQNIKIDIVPQDSVERAFAQSIRVLADPDLDNAEAQRAWERVMLGSGSVLTRGGLAAGTRTGFEPGKGYRYGNLSMGGAIESVLPTPPTLGNIIGGASPLELGLGGVGVSAYPDTSGGGSTGRPSGRPAPVRLPRPAARPAGIRR